MSGFTPKNGELHWHCHCQKNFRTRYGLIMHKMDKHGAWPSRRVRKTRRVR